MFITICKNCKFALLMGNPDHPNLPLCDTEPLMNYVTGKHELWSCEGRNKGDCKLFRPFEGKAHLRTMLPPSVKPTGHDEQADGAWAKDGDEG